MSTEEVAIRVKHVYKDFKLPHQRKNSIKSVFTGMFEKEPRKVNEVQHALKDISFEVKKGEFFGIVGRNGSGKSTLLKILAGIYQPNKGSVEIGGRLVPFIELGVGFNPELTGRENVYLNGAMLGFGKSKIDAMYADIVEFAEIERFMDQKLKNYSSGMQVRLAFSMAIRADADILLVDEVLAVGDADFQRKCFDYFRKLKKNHKTVVFVTHDMSAVVEYCDRALLIDDSKVVSISSASKIAMKYTKMFNQSSKEEEKTGKRWGDGLVKISKVSVVPSTVDRSHNESIILTMNITAKSDTEDHIAGFSIQDAAGQFLLGTNTKIKKFKLGKLKVGETQEILWEIPNIFGDGRYILNAAVVHNDGISQYDWWEEAASFRVYNDEKTPYSINPNVKVSVSNFNEPKN